MMHDGCGFLNSPLFITFNLVRRFFRAVNDYNWAVW